MGYHFTCHVCGANYCYIHICAGMRARIHHASGALSFMILTQERDSVPLSEASPAPSRVALEVGLTTVLTKHDTNEFSIFQNVISIFIVSYPINGQA